MAKARRIKSVTLRNVQGDRFTYQDVSRVFTNGDGSVTVMKSSNTPAVGRHADIVNVRTVRY